ncbi:MAG: hypothetical protein COX20_00670 [Desulfobacterales bacterium CG23_combo_of_CG06-09_8_20_14_all_52_9]|nr:MAG: hypothetical protein COX20_00670 [Desulfobacterales bacterium CG23_combo_of_CG06-09_8_20_14_all_52_9]
MEMNTRKKRQQDLILSFSKASIGRSLGMTLSFGPAGEAVFDMPLNPDFEHALGDTHGGVLATLLDNAGWFAAALHYNGWIATAEMQIRLLEPGKERIYVLQEGLSGRKNLFSGSNGY